MTPGTEGYAASAPMLLRTRLPFDQVHAPILHLFPEAPARILDVGSGPGHDAATLAGMGHDVVAAEPTPELRRGAMALYGEAPVRWLDDGLPGLKRVAALGLRFDFILISAVWMHLSPRRRAKAMPRVAQLLAPGGVLAISLRHGPAPPGRRMWPVDPAETCAQAEDQGLRKRVEIAGQSIQAVNRAMGVTWTHLAFERR